MNIGFDAKRAFQNFTGLGNYSRTLLAELQTKYPQHQYHLYSPKIRRNARTEPLFADGHFHHHSSQTLLKAWWRSRGVLKDLKRDQIDIFHGLSHELPFGIHKSEVKSVVTIHDLIFYPHPEQYGAWDRKVYHYKFRYACQRADHIIAISESTKADILRYYGVAETKVTVIRQACNPIFYEEVSFGERSAVASRWQLPQKYFLYVGSVIERKNMRLILQALPQLVEDDPDFRLVVIGGGGSYYRQMQSMAVALGLQAHIQWLTDIPFADFPAIYQNARAMVYPSYYEGFGLPVLEALASGLPAITSNRSSLPEAGGPASIYIDPDSVDELVAALRKLNQDSFDKAEMIRLGREYAETFRQGKQVQELMGIYEKLM
ncbi:MAG: glycosyltransferase family 1 protein [Bacteroidota bacterium]